MSIYQQLCFATAAIADPKCKKPRARLAQIRDMLDGGKIDRLQLAQICLDEVERESCPPPRRAAWRKQTKRLQRELRKKRASQPRKVTDEPDQGKEAAPELTQP